MKVINVLLIGTNASGKTEYLYKLHNNLDYTVYPTPVPGVNIMIHDIELDSVTLRVFECRDRASDAEKLGSTIDCTFIMYDDSTWKDLQGIMRFSRGITFLLKMKIDASNLDNGESDFIVDNDVSHYYEISTFEEKNVYPPLVQCSKLV